jgi:hypothetical protein
MSEDLSRAAKERSRQCLLAVRDAVRRMEAVNAPISLKRVAAEAKVSRNFIYTTPAALEIVGDSRDASRSRAPGRIPSRPAGGSDDSIRTRLGAAIVLIDELRRENETLRGQNRNLVNEVVNLQNPPDPANVVPIRRRRS